MRNGFARDFYEGLGGSFDQCSLSPPSLSTSSRSFSPRIRRINSCFRLVSRSQIFPRLETGRFRRALPLRDKKEEEENAGLISSAITKVKKKGGRGKKENRVIIRSMRKEYPLSNCRIPSLHPPPSISVPCESVSETLKFSRRFLPSFLPSFTSTTTTTFSSDVDIPERKFSSVSEQWSGPGRSLASSPQGMKVEIRSTLGGMRKQKGEKEIGRMTERGPNLFRRFFFARRRAKEDVLGGRGKREGGGLCSTLRENRNDGLSKVREIL